MQTARNINWTLKLGTLLFLASQLVAVVHAVEFGASAHEHQGVVCLALSTDDQIVPVPVTMDRRAPCVNLAPRDCLTTPLVVGSCAALPPSTGPPHAI